MRFLCLSFLFILTSGLHAAPPNIVFIMADDLGWADVDFHGGSAPTPRLDQLRKESVELTQHYVAPVCSPTRSALLSGRYWSRFGVTTPQSERAFPWNTVTLPRALKSVGYATCLTGKWHLGSKPEWGPNRFGFDHAYGSLGGGVGPWNHFYKEGEYSTTWHRDGTLLKEEGHATDLITQEAIQWIEARDKAQPFFLYVPLTAVHLPIRETQSWVDRVPASVVGDVPRHYAACIMHMDDAIGRILATLDKAGLRETTLLVFTSDNGGSDSQNNDQKYPADDYPTGKVPGNNLPFRGKKADVYEGGIHVPAIVNWPGKLKPGIFAAPVHAIDWMPTFCALAGYQSDHDLKWDGVNIWPALSGESALASRPLYWVGPNERVRAFRDGGWKLVVTGNALKQQTELFDIENDPNETKDLAAEMPEKVADLKARMAEIARADGDAIPKD